MSEETKVQQVQEDLNDQMLVRRDKLAEYEADGVYPFGQRFVVNAHAKDIKDDFLNFEDQPVVLAGRLMTIRSHGKTAFANIRDLSGDIQVYFRKDVLGEDEYKHVKMLDMGDIVGVEGHVFKTHMGEITVKVSKLTLLSKSLRPLPEKWHGLKDTELRYRQRYVDLIVNPEVRDTFVKRTQIVAKVREYLNSQKFMEVETPMMHAIPGGAAARPFITHHNALDIDIYMRISPELYLKRLIVGGLERVYEINRSFRNEGIDNRHNPEFTMMESYQAYGNYEDAIRLTENIVAYCAQEVLGTTKITYQGTEIDLTPPWNRITMSEGIKKYTGEDFDAVETLEEARAIADRLNVEYGPNDGIGKIQNLCFEDYVEENLIEPTFVYGHPKEISPLAKLNREKPLTTERFEAFIYGRELANGFSELNDPIDQKERFEAQLKEREAGDDEAHRMDNDYVTALEYGLPPTAGLGIGIDRLVMFLTDSASIRDVLLFPLMKPEVAAPVQEETTEEE
ncbi:lysine--tRNA ligase [Veillonella sp. YH-vei2232]|uniref:Lysine--tRNA ligase n=1 Tax=Veillonella absiana TaxID=3079305 RepID=A0ABU3ZAH6_9FIRM|nr:MULTISPECIES: lysine--tRNA ligase [unclassified Veillonella]MBP6923375.1 lysine--tRNA ligase [Veillonella sp.]MBP8615915.1 lysine--tRNA ligase [Veillonella sp.]MBP9516433.1 lysine--tRNA ligase [Veillonella sp.]MBP9550629.1 lysine--tRNA ligase [Veillonella sp.]MDV5063195.1 lysine--tRNA ligase [Veillonella sp. YH-vei2232]